MGIQRIDWDALRIYRCLTCWGCCDPGRLFTRFRICSSVILFDWKSKDSGLARRRDSRSCDCRLNCIPTYHIPDLFREFMSGFYRSRQASCDFPLFFLHSVINGDDEWPDTTMSGVSRYLRVSLGVIGRLSDAHNTYLSTKLYALSLRLWRAEKSFKTKRSKAFSYMDSVESCGFQEELLFFRRSSVFERIWMTWLRIAAGIHNQSSKGRGTLTRPIRPKVRTLHVGSCGIGVKIFFSFMGSVLFHPWNGHDSNLILLSWTTECSNSLRSLTTNIKPAILRTK